ncbi:hypothetical protein PABG_11846 [Paracoccidioides brasiliensis Pb03]|nr:hypothetical protein PABG_11846 [Paracoccidioides brasiliensis Pb03]
MLDLDPPLSTGEYVAETGSTDRFHSGSKQTGTISQYSSNNFRADESPWLYSPNFGLSGGSTIVKR